MRPHPFGLFVSVLAFFPGQFCVGQVAIASPNLGPGIVVEWVAKDSAAEKAGLKEGDILLRWSRGENKGIFESPFDLSEVNIEERPRGNVTIDGLRGTGHQTWIGNYTLYSLSAMKPAQCVKTCADG